MMAVHAPEELRDLVSHLEKRSEVLGVYAFGPDVEELWRWFQEGYRFVQAAGGAVTDEKGRLLTIHRLGRWDLPKGKVEVDEAIPAAAVREVKEECGLLDVQLIRPLCATWHTYERKGIAHLKRTDWFLMRADGTQPLKPQLEEDIDRVCWTVQSDLDAVKGDIYPSLLPVITAWEASFEGPA